MLAAFIHSSIQQIFIKTYYRQGPAFGRVYERPTFERFYLGLPESPKKQLEKRLPGNSDIQKDKRNVDSLKGLGLLFLNRGFKRDIVKTFPILKDMYSVHISSNTRISVTHRLR